MSEFALTRHHAPPWAPSRIRLSGVCGRRLARPVKSSTKFGTLLKRFGSVSCLPAIAPLKKFGSGGLGNAPNRFGSGSFGTAPNKFMSGSADVAVLKKLGSGAAGRAPY